MLTTGSLLLIAGAGGVGVYAVSKATAPVAPVGGSTVKRASTLSTSALTAYVDAKRSTTGINTLTTSQQAALNEARKRIEAEYNKLSAQAKAEGAKAVNAALGTKLTGKESFAEVTAAVGGVAGAAACSATGVGTTVAGLCAVVGGYLGKKIGDYLSSVWPDVKNWATNDLWSGVKDLGSTIYDNTLGRLF